ncbi:MAG: polysaccharide biosynthesis/export family protein [Fimbriiglobus sp.]
MRYSLLLLLGLPFLVGCAEGRLFRSLATTTGVTAPTEVPAYRLGCGDVLEVKFRENPTLDCAVSVGLDGALPFHATRRAVVAGKTLEEAHTAIALAAGSEPESVKVSILDHRASRLYLVGPEAKRHRVLAYQGPEKVMDFLWRSGAMKPGSTEIRDVQVVRPNIAAGGKPESLHIDVAGIVLHQDDATNILLMPSDQIVVGETRRSSFSRLLPDWLKPLYRRLYGLLPPDVFGKW